MSEIIEAGEDQNGQQIEMNLQQTLRVTLPEVRAAGFRWSLRTSSGRIQSPVGDEPIGLNHGVSSLPSTRNSRTISSLMDFQPLRGRIFRGGAGHFPEWQCALTELVRDAPAARAASIVALRMTALISAICFLFLRRILLRLGTVLTEKPARKAEVKIPASA
jgi:hypothetical protein